MEIVKMGELRQAGKPVKLGEQYTDGPITMEDTPTTGGMEFFKLHESCFISAQVWLPRITWVDLNRYGLDTGIYVKIRDRHYICRLPYVGSQMNERNEWDRLLEELNEKELELVNRQKFSFWGHETPAAGLKQDWNNRVVRGGGFAMARGQRPINFSNPRLGFRPVLLCIPRQPEFSSIMGHNITAYGPCGTHIDGQLLSVSDYDLVLRPKTVVPGTWSGWSRKDGNTVIIERERIMYVREARW